MGRKRSQPAFVDSAWITRSSQASPVARPFYDARDEADAWLAMHDPQHPNARRAPAGVRAAVRAEHKRQIKTLAIAAVPDVLDRPRSNVGDRMALPSIHEES